MPKGYWIAHVDVTDPEVYKKYLAANGVAFAKYGGRFLVRGGKHVVAKGSSKSRQVVIEFPDYSAAVGCLESEEYKRAIEFRDKASLIDLVVAEGYDGAQPGRSRLKGTAMAEMRLIVSGAAGRMGRMVVRTIHESDGLKLVGAIERVDSPWLGADPMVLAGCPASGLAIVADPLPLLGEADAIVDFSSPAASVELAGLAAQARIADVIGTTGLSDEDLDRIDAAARHAPIVRSGNMSVGVNLLAALTRRAASALGDDFDIEIVETHHRMKVDAPSGTALLLGQAAAEARGLSLKDHSARGRDGLTGPRRKGDIGFASLRGGTVVGDHSVIFAGEGERVVLSHHAEDRAVFARGALHAALWANGRKPGLYSMADVLGLGDG